MTEYTVELCGLVPAEYKAGADSLSISMGFANEDAQSFTVGAKIIDSSSEEPTHYFWHTWSSPGTADYLELVIANNAIPGLQLTPEEQAALGNIIIFRGTVTDMLLANGLETFRQVI